jgi:hypothetical protein
LGANEQVKKDELKKSYLVKYKLVQNQLMKKESTNTKETPASELITKFRSNRDDVSIIRDIKTLVLTGSLQWVADFIKNDGKSLIYETLALTSIFSKEEDKKKSLIQTETLLTLRGLANTTIGMEEYKKDNLEGMRLLIMYLDHPSNQAKTQVAFLAAQFCTLIEDDFDGFRIVLDAFNYYKLIKKEKTRFETLVKNIKENKIAELKFDSCCLVNGLISGSEDEIERTLIQKELLSLGLNDYYESFIKNETNNKDLYEEQYDEIKKQMTFFMTEVEDILPTTSDLKITDFNDLSSISLVLTERLEISNAYDSLMNILTQMLLFSRFGEEPSETHSKGWGVLEKIVTKSTRKELTKEERSKLTEEERKELEAEELENETEKERELRKDLSQQNEKIESLNQELLSFKNENSEKMMELENSVKILTEEKEKRLLEFESIKSKLGKEHKERLATSLLKEKLQSEKIKKQVVEFEEEKKQLKSLNDKLEKIKDIYISSMGIGTDISSITSTTKTDYKPLTSEEKEISDNQTWRSQFTSLDILTKIELLQIKEEKGKLDIEVKKLQEEIDKLVKEGYLGEEQRKKLEESGIKVVFGGGGGGKNINDIEIKVEKNNEIGLDGPPPPPNIGDGGLDGPPPPPNFGDGGLDGPPPPPNFGDGGFDGPPPPPNFGDGPPPPPNFGDGPPPPPNFGDGPPPPPGMGDGPPPPPGMGGDGPPPPMMMGMGMSQNNPCK